MLSRLWMLLLFKVPKQLFSLFPGLQLIPIWVTRNKLSSPALWPVLHTRLKRVYFLPWFISLANEKVCEAFRHPGIFWHVSAANLFLSHGPLIAYLILILLTLSIKAENVGLYPIFSLPSLTLHILSILSDRLAFGLSLFQLLYSY